MSTCNLLVLETQRISADYAQKFPWDTLDYTLGSAPCRFTPPQVAAHLGLRGLISSCILIKLFKACMHALISYVS